MALRPEEASMLRDGEHFCECEEGECQTPVEYEFDWNYSVTVGFPCKAEAEDFAGAVQEGNLAGYTTFSSTDAFEAPNADDGTILVTPAQLRELADDLEREGAEFCRTLETAAGDLVTFQHFPDEEAP